MCNIYYYVSLGGGIMSKCLVERAALSSPDVCFKYEVFR